jgi:hypothetical protein
MVILTLGLDDGVGRVVVRLMGPRVDTQESLWQKRSCWEVEALRKKTMSRRPATEDSIDAGHCNNNNDNDNVFSI